MLFGNSDEDWGVESELTGPDYTLTFIYSYDNFVRSF